jgi:hypothetical protein
LVVTTLPADILVLDARCLWLVPDRRQCRLDRLQAGRLSRHEPESKHDDRVETNVKGDRRGVALGESRRLDGWEGEQGDLSNQRRSVAGTHPDVGAVAKRHHAADDETPFRGRFPENRIDPRVLLISESYSL